MAKIQNTSGKTSVEEFALDELSGANRSSMIARARAQRAARLFAEDPKPDDKRQPQSGGDSVVPEFKFLECDPLTIDGQPAPACPFCIKDPMAYVPDYTTMFPGEVFYDGRECAYCITMEVAPPNLGGPTVDQLNNNESIKNNIKKKAIRKLLKAYNKSKVATVYYYTDTFNKEINLAATLGATARAMAEGLLPWLIPAPVNGYELVAEQRNVVEELLPYTTLHYTVPVQLKARTKIKVCIDSEVFFRAPANAIAEPETVFETGGYEVSLTGKDFSWFGTFWKVIRSMKSYNKKFTRWQNFDGGRLSKVTDNALYALNLEKEADRLEDFQSHVTTMLNDSGFKNMKNIENITFKFEPIDSGENPTIRLKQIVMNKFGCPEITFAEEVALTSSKFLELVRNDEFKRTTTLHYVGSLPEMHADVTAREPLPWLDFLLKYTYPNLKVFYGDESDSLFNDPSLGACVAESMLAGDGAVEALIMGTLEDLLSFPDALLEEFSKNLCLKPEELDKQDSDLEDKFTKELDKTLKAQRQALTKGDPYMEYTLTRVEGHIRKIPVAEQKSVYLHGKVMDRLGYCGWTALIMKALECAGKGLPPLDFKKSMVEAALGAMDDGAFQKLLIGLPPDVQAKLAGDMADELTGLPAPWDTQAYQVGNYPGAAFTKDMLYTEDQKMENEDYAAAKEAYEGLVSKRDTDAAKMGSEDTDLGTKFNIAFGADEARQQIEEAGENLVEVNNKEFPGTIVSGVQDTSGGFLGINYDGEDFSFGEQSQGSGGTYGTALGNIQKDVFDAYKNQALKSLGVDTLLNEMGKLPGVPIIASFLTSLPCKPTPLWAFDPRLDSFMNTLEFDFCSIPDGGAYDLTLPKWQSKTVGWNNLWKAFRKALKEVLHNLLVSVAMRAIKAIIKWVLNLACDLLAFLGANLGDLLTGSDKFSDLLANELCPGQDPETVNDALLDLFTALGGMDASCLSEVTGEDMGAFMDDLSLMLTQDQVCALLRGTADAETLALAAEVARASASECIAEVFSSQDMIESLFSALGRLMPVDDICAASAGAVPVDTCPPDTLAAIEELRCELLSDKGLTPEECRDELDKLKDAALDAVKELADLMNNGPYGGMPPLIGDACTEGILSGNNPLLDQVTGAVSGMILSPIETGVIDDMFGRVTWWAGRGGFFNTVLSDTEGRPWKSHDFAVRYFGAPQANQQGFLEFYSDDAIKSVSGDPFKIDLFGGEPGLEIFPKPVNIYNEEVNPANILDFSSGGFPPTVAAWLAKHYREMDPVFNTVTIPAGYSSIQEANDDVAEKAAANSANLESRIKYIEAFIFANKLDENDSDQHEIRLAGILRKTVQMYHGDLFLPPETASSLATVNTGDDEYDDAVAEAGAAGYDDAVAEAGAAGYDDAVAEAAEASGSTDEASDEAEEVDPFPEPEDLTYDQLLTRTVLLGRDIGYAITSTTFSEGTIEYEDTTVVSIEVGEGAHPSDWKVPGQEAAGTNGLPWADWAVINLDTIVPPEVPDATTSDLTLKYIGHADEEVPLGYTVGYDYNLFEEGSSVDKGGNYRIKITKDIPFSVVLEEPALLLETHNIKVESGILPEVQVILDDLPLSESVSDSWQIETFYRLISQEIINNSTSAESAKTALSSPSVREYFAGTTEGADRVYDSISSGFIRRIANRVATGRSYPEPNVTIEEATADDFLTADTPRPPQEQNNKILENIAPSFLFGYDPKKGPKIIKLDNETYGGPLAQLFPDVFPLPFYVQPPEYKGWMDLVDALMPAPDECKPAGSLFFDLSELQSIPSEVGNQLIEDPRLSYDPLCSQEAPYDKIYPNITIGSLEMVMRATTRIYLSSNLLESIAVVSQFSINDENYDEGFFEYIAEEMKNGLIESGRRVAGKSSNEYYYRFLEQVVNVTARKVVSGMIDPETDFTEEEKEAYDIIADKVLSFYKNNDGELAALSTTAISQQTLIRKWLSNGAADSIAGLGAGSAAFNKRSAQAAKDGAFDLMIYETKDQAMVFLKRMIREEMNAMGKVFNERLLQPVQNIDHLFLLSTTWIRGGLNGGGPIDVMSDPTDPNKYEIPSGKPGTTGGLALKFAQTDAQFAASLESAFADMEEWPFVLEKYIRIIEKDTPNDLGRAENLYGVVNINDWDAFVANASQNNSGNISDLWGEYELSSETLMVDEHIHTYELDENGNGKTMAYLSGAGEAHYHEIINFEMQDPIAGEAPTSVLTRPDDTSDGPLLYTGGNHVHELDMPAWRFGLRICYMPEKDKTGIFTDAIKEVSASTAMQEKAFKVQSPEGERVLIPIASAEINIPDQDFSLFDPESYDVYCLIQDLIDTPTYKTWFRYVFPLPRFVTILAIYNATCFMDSLGNTGLPQNGGDMWEKKGGNSFKGFKRWDRDNMFHKSKKEARTAFRSLYQTTQAEYSSDPELFQMPKISFLELMRPLINFDDGLYWWQRGRRIKNKPEDLC